MRAIVLCVLILFPSVGSAEVLALCGELTGYDYYPTSLHVPRSQSGWTDSEIGKQTWTAIIATKAGDDIEYDVAFTDATKQAKSLRQQGYLVIPVNADHRTIHLIGVHHGGSTEMYVLDREQRLLSLLAYKMKPLRLTRAMTAQCK